MLNVQILDFVEIEQVATVFDRDRIVRIEYPLSGEHFVINEAGAQRVMQEHEDEFGREYMNRGYVRHSSFN